MSNQQPKRIILIDDDPIANMISTRIIGRAFSASVIAFPGGHEALEQINIWWGEEGPEHPVAIFLDINMPHMDGWEFLKEFEKLPGRITEKCMVAMLTSSIDVDDIEKSKRYRLVREFISKPLTQDKLAILNHIQSDCGA